MISNFLRTFILIPTVGMLLASPCSARTWTSAEGKKLTADIVSKTKTSVVLLIKGKEVTLPLSKLSKADQIYVRNWKAPAKPAQKKKAEVDAFSGKWPKLVKAPSAIKIVESRGSAGEYIYSSPHYDFIANAKLSGLAAKRFAALFEATRNYMAALPLGNSKAHRTGKRYKIYLFETKAQYIKAGGPAKSGGVYMSGRDIILVPFESLGLFKKGSAWQIDYKRANQTLPHEITHQLTDPEFYSHGADGWYSEGLAEYISTTPYRGGKFSVNNALSEIKQSVTGFSKKTNSGSNLGTTIKVGSLERFMKMPYSQFTAKANHNYGVGLLLTTYFFYYDLKGDGAAMQAFLKALKAGKKGDAALQALLNGRSFKELEQQIHKAWSKRGVKLIF